MKVAPNFDKYTTLRKRFQAFYFNSFQVTRDQSKIKIRFNFSFDDKYVFKPQMTVNPNEHTAIDSLSDEQLNQLAFHIGMVELVSYWKAACPKNVIIKPYRLSSGQINFWKKLYFNGLGEFFYTNGLQPSQDEFMEIKADTGSKMELQRFQTTRHFIVPVGGGKDSVVTLQLLGEFYEKSREIIPFIMNPRGASLNTTLNAGFNKKNIFTIDRTIDPELLKLNEEGFLNGHTPFSALLAFTTLLVSALTRNRYIALSNESSANEATVPGTNINHQYSKSFEFENDFRAYVKEYISDQFEYFSFLRPLSEMQIARVFSLYEQYYSSFRSCNVGSKQNVWCAKCPKCLFTYIILSPFMENETLKQIFGSDLLDAPELMDYYRDLSGQSEAKPFECVGTTTEVNAALALSINEIAEKKLPVILKDFRKSDIYEHYAYNTSADWVLQGFEENNLPEDVLNKLREFMLKVYCK